MPRGAGFTMVELMVASSLSVVVLGMAMTAFMQAMWVWNQESVVNQLNMDLEIATQWMRRDLRLSSVGTGHMAFYPAESAQYEAISLPLAEDSDGDGLLERDDDNSLLWDKTVVYHVRPGAPSELRRTVFEPRYSNATPAQLYDQLAVVVESSNAATLAAAKLPGESMATKIIFKNLADLRVHPPTMEYDGYAPGIEKEATFNMGGVVLDGGMHELVLAVVGKNINSAGYKIGIDWLAMSGTQSRRDGELFPPVNSHPASPHFEYSISGGSVIAEDMSQHGANWDGKSQLTFDPVDTNTASGTPWSNSITFKIYNDLWVDNSFHEPAAAYMENVGVTFDESFTNSAPYVGDYVVTLEKGLAWGADRPNEGDGSEIISGQELVITNIIYGGSNDAAAIALNGEWVRLRFKAAESQSTYIHDVSIIDETSGSATNVTFDNGDGDVYIVAGSDVWSDWVEEWVIDKDKNYRVALRVGGAGDLDLDMIVGDNTGKLTLYENLGTPQVAAWVPGDDVENLAAFATPAFADIDGDGDADALIGNSGGTLTFIERTGTPLNPDYEVSEEDWESIDVGSYSTPAFADIDADGDYDLFVGESGGSIRFYENTGSRQNPVWASPVAAWQGIDISSFSSPAFVDIDNDDDLDLFTGESRWNGTTYLGWLYYIENTGTRSNFQYATIVSNYEGISSALSRPAFADIDADNDYDLFVGGIGGEIQFYRNTGNSTNPAWGETNLAYNSIHVGAYSAPAFFNINEDLNGLRFETNSTTFMATTNGVPAMGIYCLAEIEVGYPSNGIYRSGIFDTRNPAPEYNRLAWTHEENSAAGGDIQIRIRSAASESAVKSASWTAANAINDGYFDVNTGNALATLPRQRYAQYEARLQCLGQSGHTNDLPPKLRDVTIDWPGERGIVDLQVGFSRGPDYGIVEATVDGQSFIRGTTAELTIYRYSRPLGTNTVTGQLEIKPLNTGH